MAAFEVLENRRLMSNSVSLSGGVLALQGSTTAGTSLTVELIDNGSYIDADAGGEMLVAATSSVKEIQITGGGGADYIFVDNRITSPATITGGAGNDTIRGGGGKTTITDGSGNDWISAPGTADSITAGSGNDTILGGVGPDTIIAGGGNDSISGAGGNDSITVGNGNDTITGGNGNITIAAGNGRDSLAPGHGDDIITVGTGLSTVASGSGTNRITLGNKADTIVNYGGKNTVVYATTSSGSSSTTNASTGTTAGSNSGSGTTTASSSTSGSSGSTTSTDPTGTPATSVASGKSVVIGSTTWTAYSAPAASGTNPVAVMDILDAPFTAGIAVDVRGLGSSLGSGTAINANYQWNFGDPSGANNEMTGYNASHIFSGPGTYTVSLTITNDLGKTSSVAGKVVITPDTRRAIYVNSVTGNDNNNGLTANTAVKTAARADALVGNNTEVFFARGETFNLSAAFKLNDTNVLVGTYGTGAQPILNYTDPVEGSVILTTNSNLANGVTIEDLTLTALNAAGTGLTSLNPPMGVNAGGDDTSVVGCTFDYVEYAVNGNSAPVGLNLYDNTSPSATGLMGYFLWDQGTDTTVIGNYAAGSVQEHILRTSSASEINILDNNFTNSDGKGCIEIHEGSYAWINGNTVTGGDIRVGPLGLWNEPVTSSTDDCVIENNKVYDTQINVFPGAHSISIRDNIIHDDSGQMIDVQGQDSAGRQSSDIEILNNTGISTGTEGNFLYVVSYTDGILLENNLLVEPNLVVGGYSTAPVYVDLANLDSFTTINGNVWQLPAKFDAFANGGINFVEDAYGTSGYLTPAEWNDESVVGTDYFYNVAIDSSTGAPAVGSPIDNIDSAAAGVYGDINGNTRPAGGGWTAGAVQV
jgi:hypothetical protein